MNKTVKSNSIAKVPIVMQMEATECGAASLTMILAYYGKWLPLEQVREDCGVSRDGAKAKNIALAAKNYGLNVRAFRYEPEELQNEGTYPCIIHWNFNHFVVLNGIKNGKAYINDPAKGTYFVSWEEFDKAFTGICLMFEPSEDFEPGGKRASILSFTKKRLRGTKSAVVFIILTSAAAALIGLIAPAMNRIFLDRLLTRYNPEWFYPFALALAMLAVLQVTAEWIKSICALRINGKLTVGGSAGYLWKVLRLPMRFFSQRMAGDLQERQFDYAEIAETLVNTLAPLLINSAMMIFYFIIMLTYSASLAVIGLSSVVMNAAISKYISAKCANITRVQMRDAGKLASATVSGIEMIETIKSSGAENSWFEKWSGYQASVNTQNVEFQKTSGYLALIPRLISAAADVTVLMTGVWLTVNGEFTVGMIMAFQGFLTAFSQPASTLISAGETLRELRTKTERIEDVMEYPSDENIAEDSLDEDEYDKLSGNVEIKNLTFGYSRLEPPLITDFSLNLKQGSRVAFVGSSGCGKSTIAKLVSGLYRPWSGEILFDGKHISEIDRNVFTGSLAVVDQDIILFEDTIANNIKMWDSSIEDFEMILAARDARLHEDIMQREGGYNYVLAEGGKDLSGGQRQRLEIARVLAQDPTIIIMDEATSALDAKTEYDVVKSIKDRGITCIVIAHRLSTIRDCDEILVMDKGKVVQRGTHEDLYTQDGLYRELVTSE